MRRARDGLGEGPRKPLVTVEHQTEIDLQTGKPQKRMFVKMFFDAVDDGLLRELSPRLWRGLCCIARYVRDDGTLRVSQERIASDLGISRQHANALLRDLVAFRRPSTGEPVLGLLERGGFGGEGRKFRSNVYRLHAVAGFQFGRGGEEISVSPKGDSEDADSVSRKGDRETRVPCHPEGDRVPCHPGGDTYKSTSQEEHTPTAARVCVSGNDSGELDRKARNLIGKFREAFGRSPEGRVSAAELGAARAVIEDHGERVALELVRVAPAESEKTRYIPRLFQGIVQFVPDAVASIEAKNASRERRVSEKLALRTRRESYLELPPEKRAEEQFKAQLTLAKIRKKRLSEAEKEALYERLLAAELAKDASSAEEEPRRATG